MDFDETGATEEVAERLGLAVGEAVVALVRIRYAEGRPLALMHNWLPARHAAFSAADLEEHGLYALLRNEGINIAVASQRIGASAASAAEARPLELRRPAALLTMERVAFDDGGRPVELGRHVYPAEQYIFEITVVSG